MDKQFYNVLELDKIIEQLKMKASSELGKSIIENLEPFSSYGEVEMALKETTEAQSILIKRGHIPIQGIHNIIDKVKRADIGATIDAKSLLQIADTMRTTRILSNILSGDIKVETFGNAETAIEEEQDDIDKYPIIQSLARSLYIHKDLEEEIFNAIVSEIEISDSASSDLRSTRRRIIQKNQSIRSKLNSIISSTTYQKYLQDSIISMRGDRFVVPVKAEYRSMVSGIIHDQSSSGATLFIEPMSIVEMNNDLRQLKLEEAEEIERILAELSAMVAEVSRELISNQEILSKLDFIFAKGKLSLEMKAVEAKLNRDKKFRIVNGRHPLLDKSSVVANTVYLGEDFTTLLITGPNTGGKTVTIKMVGIFALMTQCGLHIPADYGSSMCVFDNIFADIGDDQSIEQSLSTFSSHMTRIVDILDNVTENSLVIFDELGAGTDPEEGAALAIAILEDIRMAGASCIATTHYSELKKYALAKPDVENAAVEFDMEELSPTYRLLIGVPGKSNAFEISRKLGLQNHIIDRAKDFLTSDNIELEDVLQNVEKSRLKTEEELRRAEKMREEVENIRNEYNIKMEKMQTSRDKMLENARSEAFSIIRQAKDSTDNMIKELKEIEKQRASKDKDRRIEKIRKEISESMGKLQPSVESMVVPKYASKEIKNLKAGEDVDIITLRQEGTVISADDKKKEALVQVGIMKMNLPYKSLKRIEKKEQSNVTRTTRKIIRSKSGNVKREVDLRGMNLEEAIMKVEKYLDDACMAGHDEVTIIHGIGTGVLKKGISEWLKTNPHVKSMREGKYGEGGIGVTIVTVK
ncbi:recombination and DNA strand exchange inhibitor protein [Peptostreptococcus russellii]|uniref:Endonuclease MutS2 n=1 Tax=Peptostreptococcus russellii TaxID=215200 RepID=A0A2P7PYW2_9FIRM|nr:endonuclease MutS2 [Peptostreptococcus russellii]PSJ30899.1 recombination and DNA strand exchange inhibitor protein [Peptostreptococcus russellii]